METIFNSLGGEFTTPFDVIEKKLVSIKAFIFDWDGVFHSGTKNEKSESTFSEIDAMGSNILRFSYWLNNNKQMPVVGVISGGNNPTAIHFAQRQHYDFITTKAINKNQAIKHICEKYYIKPSEIAFAFDDILDISIAKICGLRFLVANNSTPLFKNYVIDNQLCDYITANTGGKNAVREITELIAGLNNNFNQAVTHRIDFSETYKQYWTERGNIKTEIIKN